MHIHRYSSYHSGKCYDHGILVRDIPVVDVWLVDGKVAGVPRPLATAYQKTKCHVLEDGNLHKCRDLLAMLPLKAETISIHIKSSVQ